MTTEMPRNPAQSQAPLGPKTLFWDEFGSLLFQSLLSQAFLLQVCHPIIEAGVAQHSTYRSDPLGRARRSVKLLWPVLYARPERAIRKGQELRDMHRAIKGIDKDGNKYYALDPEAYSWVHITGFDVIVRSHQLFGKKLTEEQQEQLFQEWRQFGLMLGVSEKFLPATQADYWDYFNRIIRERLAIESVAQNLLYDNLDFAQPDSLKLPDWLWKLLLKTVSRQQRFITRATLPTVFRERFNIAWSRTDATIFWFYRIAFKIVYALLPERLRFIPLAYKARVYARKHPEAYVHESTAVAEARASVAV